MAKPLGTEPATSAQTPQKPDLALCLVVEEGDATRMTEGLRQLRQWLKPQATAIRLILAVPEVVDPKWLFNKARLFADTLAARQREVLEKADRIDNFLLQDGFQIRGEGPDVMSDRGARLIIDDLQKQPVDLLVVLSESNSSFSHRLVAHAPCSTLLLRDIRPPREPAQPAQLLVGVDGTDSANRAVEKLPDLIRTRPLHASLLCIINTAYFENSLAAPFVNITAMETAMQENAGMLMDIAKGVLQAQGVEVTQEVALDGPPAWTMAMEAKERNPDLVVTGSHNRSDFAAWLLGSVSWRMLQSDRHNLLIVR